MTDFTWHSAYMCFRDAAVAAKSAHDYLAFSQTQSVETQTAGEIWAKSQQSTALKELSDAASLLGFKLVEKEKPATGTAQSADILSTAGPYPQNGGPAPQGVQP